MLNLCPSSCTGYFSSFKEKINFCREKTWEKVQQNDLLLKITDCAFAALNGYACYQAVPQLLMGEAPFELAILGFNFFAGWGARRMYFHSRYPDSPLKEKQIWAITFPYPLVTGISVGAVAGSIEYSVTQGEGEELEPKYNWNDRVPAPCKFLTHSTCLKETTIYEYINNCSDIFDYVVRQTKDLASYCWPKQLNVCKVVTESDLPQNLVFSCLTLTGKGNFNVSFSDRGENLANQLLEGPCREIIAYDATENLGKKDVIFSGKTIKNLNQNALGYFDKIVDNCGESGDIPMVWKKKNNVGFAVSLVILSFFGGAVAVVKSKQNYKLWKTLNESNGEYANPEQTLLLQ